MMVKTMNSKITNLRYSELFFSCQGEGRYTGVPSIFLRVFGCNFRCKSFGRDPNDIIDGPNPEVQVVIDNIKNYKTLEELPLVKTGCDSYLSIYPQFKKFAKDESIETIIDKMLDLLPRNSWSDNHLVITGGEPLLKAQQAKYIELLRHEKMWPLKELTFETNGTQMLTPEFIEFLTNWGNISNRNYHQGVTFSVSVKLSNSGESREDAINTAALLQYQKIGFTYLKFVVDSEETVIEAINTAQIFHNAGFNGPVYLMPSGGTTDTFSLNNKRVAELALKNGIRYSDRLHLSLYGNSWNT